MALTAAALSPAPAASGAAPAATSGPAPASRAPSCCLGVIPMNAPGMPARFRWLAISPTSRATFPVSKRGSSARGGAPTNSCPPWSIESASRDPANEGLDRERNPCIALGLSGGLSPLPARGAREVEGGARGGGFLEPPFRALEEGDFPDEAAPL